MFNLIKKFLNEYKKDIIYIVVILTLFIALLSSVRTCTNNDNRHKANLIALNDTISIFKAKNNNLVAAISGFECDMSELRLLNKKLYDEIDNLKLKNSATTGIHFGGNIDYGQSDTIYIISHDTISNGFIHKFDFSNNWRSLYGDVTFKNDSLSVNLLKDIVKFEYTVAMDKDNRIYITSENPYIEYNEIQGFTVPRKKEKHFSVGPHIGIGYDPFKNKPVYYIGIGLQYNLIKF